jgi:hypothetical protein
LDFLLELQKNLNQQHEYTEEKDRASHFRLCVRDDFARTVQGMENSLQAVYESRSGAERGLLMYNFQSNGRTQSGRRLINNPYGNINYNSSTIVDEPDPTNTPFFIKSLSDTTPVQFE